MKFKKVRKLLGDNIYYMIGVDGDYVGNYSRDQLKQFNKLYIKSIWAVKDRSDCICLDLFTKL